MYASKAFVPATGLSLALLTAAVCQAAPCPPMVDSLVIAGSTAIQPLVRELAKVTLANTSTKLYYAGLGSCLGVQSVVAGSSLTDVTLSSWNAAGEETKCDLGAEGVSVDIGVSDVFPASCISLPGGLPSNIGDFLGPVQTMVFAVPRSSEEAAISAEAAYYVYGFGEGSGVEPWTDETLILQRDEESGTQTMVGLAIGVPADRFRGTHTAGSGDLLEQLASVSADKADSAIGILSASHAEQNRSTLRTLAFQDFGATCAVLPNRTELSHEKENVRNGLYPIWGPVHMLAAVDERRRPAHPLAAQLIGFITGSLELPATLDLLALQAEENVVPQCAMRVTRTHEMGPVAPYLPAQLCGCAYEEAANGTTDCTPCQSTPQCGSGQTCSFGYCEAL